MGVGCWREWGKRGKGRWGVDVVEGGRWEREEGVQKEKGKLRHEEEVKVETRKRGSMHIVRANLVAK